MSWNIKESWFIVNEIVLISLDQCALIPLGLTSAALITNAEIYKKKIRFRRDKDYNFKQRNGKYNENS